jgi:hypothetical protein
VVPADVRASACTLRLLVPGMSYVVAPFVYDYAVAFFAPVPR